MFRIRAATFSKSSHNFSPFGVSCQRPLIRARKLAGSPSSHSSASNRSALTVVAPDLRQNDAIFFVFHSQFCLTFGARLRNAVNQRMTIQVVHPKAALTSFKSVGRQRTRTHQRIKTRFSTTQYLAGLTPVKPPPFVRSIIHVTSSYSYQDGLQSTKIHRESGPRFCAFCPLKELAYCGR